MSQCFRAGQPHNSTSMVCFWRRPSARRSHSHIREPHAFVFWLTELPQPARYLSLLAISGNGSTVPCRVSDVLKNA